MDNGFITLHRKILDHPVCENPGIFHLFVHLLFKANWKENRTLFNGKELTIKRGQLITGRLALAQELKQKPSTIRNWLQVLKNLEILDIESNSKFSLITIRKYSDYQDRRENKDSKKDSQRTAKGQPEDTLEQREQREQYNSMQTAFAEGSKEILNIFYETINPTIKFQNKTFWKDASALIEKVGLEKAKGAAKYAVSVQATKYAPTITNPTQLLNKYGELQGFYAKNNIKSDLAII